MYKVPCRQPEWHSGAAKHADTLPLTRATKSSRCLTVSTREESPTVGATKSPAAVHSPQSRLHQLRTARAANRFRRVRARGGTVGTGGALGTLLGSTVTVLDGPENVLLSALPR